VRKRQNTDHVSHVVFCVRPEDMDDAWAFWSALGVELLEHTREDYGLRILYGWNSGVEIITSKGAGPFADQINAHLAEHGPGVFSVVYGVPSIAAAVEQVRQAGADVQVFETPMVGDEPWFDRYDHLQEGAVVGMDDLRLAIVEKRHREEIPSEAGHVSHVIYVMDPKRLDANAAFLKDALGVEFDDVETGTADLRVLYSFDAGLELLGPEPSSEGPIAEGLRAHGDGPLLVAFQVPDIEAAAATAATYLGEPPARRISYTGLPGWTDRYEVLEEVVLEPYRGLEIVLMQMDLVGE
jgi:4-hydroxyphenylpyruvate dioxygenase-like putative hemolysin